MFSIIILIVGLVVASVVVWKLLPVITARLQVVDGLSLINKMMVFICLIFALFLLWVGLPAFTATIKFFLFGHSFADLFQWRWFKPMAGTLGEILLYFSAIILWIAVNSAELYPRAVKASRATLEAMLKQRKANRKFVDNPDDDIGDRTLKHSIRNSATFSLGDAQTVSFLGFMIDTAIAVTNTPVLKSGANIDKLIRLADFSQLNLNQIGILAMLIGGMTANAFMFDKFNKSSQISKPKAKSKPKSDPNPTI
jgi:hypothetical protein